MKTKNASTTKEASSLSARTIAQTPSPIAAAPTLTPEQLEEALEERVNPDRRKKARTLPEAIIDRRSNERRL